MSALKVAPTWQHTESSAATTYTAALNASRNKAWNALNDETCARYLRMLAVMTLQATRQVDTQPPIGATGFPELGVEIPGPPTHTWKSNEHHYVAAAAARTLVVLAQHQGQELGPFPGIFSTTDGSPPSAFPTEELGYWPIVIAIVAAGLLVSAAAVWIGHESNQVENLKNIREEDTKRMLAAQADVLTLIAQHTQKEKAAKKTLPYDPMEIKLADRLLNTQKVIVEKREQPLPAPWSGAIDSLTGAVSTAVPYLGIALGVGVLYVLTK